MSRSSKTKNNPTRKGGKTAGENAHKHSARGVKDVIAALWAAPKSGENSLEYKPKISAAVLAALFAAAFFIFYLTSAPTIVTEGDAAEFTAAAAVRGIAHPPGYPAYIFLSWLLGLLVPAMHLARALNLLSVLCGALAATAIAAIIITMARRYSHIKPLTAYIGAAVAALTTTFSLEIWTQAISAEVYTMSLFIIFASLWLSVHELGEKYPQIILFLLAFGYGVHHTIIVLSLPILAGYFFRTRLNMRGRYMLTLLVIALVPAFLIFKNSVKIAQLDFGERFLLAGAFILIASAITVIFYKKGGYKGSRLEIITSWLAYLLGLSFYLYLPLASSANPPMDFVNPETYKGFWDLITMAGMPSLNPESRDFAMWSAQFGSFFSQWWRQFPAAVFDMRAQVGHDADNGSHDDRQHHRRHVGHQDNGTDADSHGTYPEDQVQFFLELRGHPAAAFRSDQAAQDDCQYIADYSDRHFSYSFFIS